MANDDFDPMEKALEAAGKMKPTKMVKTAAGVLPGAAKELVGAGADAFETGMDAMDTDGMAEAIAARLDMSVEKLKTKSSLAATAIAYHHNGEAALNTAVDIGTDVAAGFTGPVGFGAKMLFDYTMAEEKPDPTGDLRKVFEFASYEGSVTPAMVFDVIKAKVSPADRKKLQMYGEEGLGSDSAIKKYVGDLIGPDFVPGDETALEYLARKFNDGEYERATLIMNRPEALPPLDALSEEAGQDYGRDTNVVAAGDAGTLSYRRGGDNVAMASVGEADDFEVPRFPMPSGGKRRGPTGREDI